MTSLLLYARPGPPRSTKLVLLVSLQQPYFRIEDETTRMTHALDPADEHFYTETGWGPSTTFCGQGSLARINSGRQYESDVTRTLAYFTGDFGAALAQILPGIRQSRRRSHRPRALGGSRVAQRLRCSPLARYLHHEAQ